jgi:hypothetical protein
MAALAQPWGPSPFAFLDTGVPAGITQGAIPASLMAQYPGAEMAGISPLPSGANPQTAARMMQNLPLQNLPPLAPEQAQSILQAAGGLGGAGAAPGIPPAAGGYVPPPGSGVTFPQAGGGSFTIDRGQTTFNPPPAAGPAGGYVPPPGSAPIFPQAGPSPYQAAGNMQQALGGAVGALPPSLQDAYAGMFRAQANKTRPRGPGNVYPSFP